MKTELVASYFGTVSRLLAAHHDVLCGGLERFFTTLRPMLENKRIQAKEENRRSAAGFNVFDYIWPDENKLSDVIADLLDPNGSHGQRDTFLKRFFLELQVPTACDYETVKVYREEMTTYIANPLRRIDILVDFDSFGLAIENKPWTAEQPRQVHDYLEHLHNRFKKNFLLVYLSGDGSPPKSVAIAKLSQLHREDHFRLLEYQPGLLAWLNACSQECQADKVRWFLDDFKLYVKSTFRPVTDDWRTTHAE
jgi:hypothetical protein